MEQRRERSDLIEVFMILKGHTNVDPALFWEVREARGGARLVKGMAGNGRTTGFLLISSDSDVESSTDWLEKGTVAGLF